MIAALPQPGAQAVYNLELAGEHVYHVSPAALLIHNSYVRNPNGRRGSPAHQQKILEAESKPKSKGWKTHSGGSRPEQKFGNRYPDLVMEKGNKRIAIQVGKHNPGNRQPVARERRAISDLRNYKGDDGKGFDHVFFVEY